MAKKARRKPNEPARKGTRFQVNILLTGEAKDHIVAAAKASGRTTSREAEYLIETAITYNRILKVAETTIAQIEKGNVEAALHRLGYTSIRHAGTGKKAWAEPGYPGTQHSGFEAFEPGELEAGLEQAAIIRQAAGISDADIERSNREKLRQADEESAPKKDDAA